MAVYISKDLKYFKLLEHYVVRDRTLDFVGSDWVRYQNTETGQEYTCRLEAFAERFREVEATDSNPAEVINSLKNGFK